MARRTWAWFKPELVWAAPLALLLGLHWIALGSPGRQAHVAEIEVVAPASTDGELVALGLANERAVEARHDVDANGRERLLIERELRAL